LTCIKANALLKGAKTSMIIASGRWLAIRTRQERSTEQLDEAQDTIGEKHGRKDR
jgi:hypothetical protein